MNSSIKRSKSLPAVPLMKVGLIVAFFIFFIFTAMKLHALQELINTQKDEIAKLQTTQLTQEEVDARVLKGFAKLTWSRTSKGPSGTDTVNGINGASNDVFKDRGDNFLYLYRPTKKLD
jgi:hypothetical protein